MSWVLGYVGNGNDTIVQKIQKVCKSRNETIKNGRLIVFTGEKNVHTGNAKAEPGSGFIAAGIGLQHNGNSFAILSNSDWQNKAADLQSLPEGHFIIIRWDENTISFYADAAGIRDLYIAPYENGYLFSTRLDWISCITGNTIDFHEFGSRWLLINQLSSSSILKNTVRVVRGMKAVISGNELDLSNNTSDESVYTDFNTGDFYTTMKALLLAPAESGMGTSLSLSGGFDSRVMLSLLQETEIPDLVLHTFGDPSHPDSVVAKRIAALYNLRHMQFTMPDEQHYGVDDLLDFAGQSLMGHPVSALRQLDNYRSLQEYAGVVVDGGFGEIWRREFLNRLLFQGKSLLKSRDPEAVLPYLRYPKADIFIPEINAMMEEGCLKNIEMLFNQRDNYKSDEDFIDSIARSYRLMNYYGQEQARVDNYITSYMPFAQHVLLKNLLTIPLSERKNGKMLKKFIARSANELTKIPLVKGNAAIPYGYPTLINRIYTKIKSRFNSSKNGNSNATFLQNHVHLIEEVIHSRSFRECAYYDNDSIVLLFERFNSGDYSAAAQLDWWLTFELFRRSADN